MVNIISVNAGPLPKPALFIVIVQLANGPCDDNGEWNTPAYTDEHPFPQFVCGVCQYYGCVQIAALAKHPEEVGHMEIIIRCCDQPAPDHIALMYLWIHGELHHKPGGISQDKCRNQVPVDDISQTPDTPEPHKEDEGDQQGSQRDAVSQVVYDDCNVVMQLALLLLIEDFLTLGVVSFLCPGAISQTFSVHIIGGVVSDPEESLRTGAGHHFSSTTPGPACPNAINRSVTKQTCRVGGTRRLVP